jgi:ATP-dependent DNA ligase
MHERWVRTLPVTPGRPRPRELDDLRIESTAATPTHERFESPEWIFERKLDGVRLLAFRSGKEVQLLSRNRSSSGVRAVARAIARLPVTRSSSTASCRGKGTPTPSSM